MDRQGSHNVTPIRGASRPDGPVSVVASFHLGGRRFHLCKTHLLDASDGPQGEALIPPSPTKQHNPTPSPPVVKINLGLGQYMHGIHMKPLFFVSENMMTKHYFSKAPLKHIFVSQWVAHKIWNRGNISHSQSRTEPEKSRPEHKSRIDPEQSISERSKAGQSRAQRSITEQSRPEQRRAEQGRESLRGRGGRCLRCWN